MLKIGWASCDISTDKPVAILGQAHIRISKGVHDPVTATALVLENSGDCAVFVSVDMVSCGPHLLDMVRARVAASEDGPAPEKIVMHATHTHDGGPRSRDDELFGSADSPEGRMPLKLTIASGDEYLEFLADSLTGIILRAWRTRTGGGYAYGYGYAVVAHSRRVCYFDDISLRGAVDKANTFAVNGHAAMYGRTNDDMFSHYEAGANPFMNLLYTFDTEGKLTGAVINVPCPSQNSENIDSLSASFWNEVRILLHEKYGDIFILPQCAAGGDQSPRQLHYLEAENRRYALKYGTEPEDIPEMFRRRDIAERIAAGFDEVLSWAKKDIRTDALLVHTVKKAGLSRMRIGEQEYCDAKEGLALLEGKPYADTGDAAADFRTNTRMLSDLKRCRNVIRRHTEQDTVKKLPVELHTVRLGDIAFATNPFELYMDFEHRIAARSPFIQTFVAQLCAVTKECPTSGYLCTERAYAGRGYSAIVYSCQVSPEGGQELVEETLDGLKKLAEL